MRTEQPLANLHRRLGVRHGPAGDAGASDPDPCGGLDGVAADLEPPAPSWVPDGQPPRGFAWLTAIRADPGRAGVLALGALGSFAVLVTVFTLIRQSPPPVASAKLPPVEMVSSATTGPGRPPAQSAQPQPDEAVVVSVVGLVRQPGLVTLAPTARIADALAAAGGSLAGADMVGLNLARRVADGEQVVVGIATPAGRPASLNSSLGPGSPAAPPVVTTAAPAGPLDLNAATTDQLDALPGVGPVTAAAIVAWRQGNGGFTNVDQLSEVDGIGPARLEKLRPLVRV